jgi:hypothetical protein
MKALSFYEFATRFHLTGIRERFRILNIFPTTAGTPWLKGFA